jgi:uncharacterized protein YfaS (alpha-2-macroglobulin family)
MSESLKYSYSINSGEMKNITENKTISQKDISISGTKSGNITIKNTNRSILYARVILQGIPQIGTSQNDDSNMRMTVKYTLPNGTVISPEKIEQGTDFIAEVTVTHQGYLKPFKEMALTQIFPSGWEIINTRLYNVGSSVRASSPEYIDIKDDRIYTYFDLRKGKNKTFKVMLNASYAGKFWMPAVHCEAMYDAIIFSQKGGMYVNVE